MVKEEYAELLAASGFQELADARSGRLEMLKDLEESGHSTLKQTP